MFPPPSYQNHSQDSYGDGWVSSGFAAPSIWKVVSDGNTVQTGTLLDGSEGVDEICHIELGECFNFSVSSSAFESVSGGASHQRCGGPSRDTDSSLTPTPMDRFQEIEWEIEDPIAGATLARCDFDSSFECAPTEMSLCRANTPSPTATPVPTLPHPTDTPTVTAVPTPSPTLCWADGFHYVGDKCE